MDALKLRKEVSKPGLLQAVRGVFDPVVGRKFSIGTCLMSGQWHSDWRKGILVFEDVV